MLDQLRHSAFTILEMILVLTILTILCALSIPAFIDYDRQLVVQELEKIEVILRYLQQRAMVTQHVQSFTLTVTANSYAYNTVRHTMPDCVCYGYLQAAYGPPGDPTASITSVATFPTPANGVYDIKIFPNGKISAGALYIRTINQTRMGALTCTVSQVSYLRKYMYESGQWVLLAS
jgi:type II secretory pathway pseudopilin PulG